MENAESSGNSRMSQEMPTSMCHPAHKVHRFVALILMCFLCFGEFILIDIDNYFKYTWEPIILIFII